MRGQDADTFLVDGYNVIRRNPELRAREDRRDLEAGREALLGRILASRLPARCRVIVVFDGAGDMPACALQSRAGLEVRFSRPPQNADQAILSILKSRHDNSSVVVVTADRELEWEAKKLGARVTDPEEWISAMMPHGPKQRKEDRGRPEKPVSTKEEVGIWLEIFGPASIQIAPEAGRKATKAASPVRAKTPDDAGRSKERRRKRYLRRSERRR